MSAKASGGSRNLPSLDWISQPLARTPLTPLPLVRELWPPEAIVAWISAGGRVFEGRLVP